MIKKLKMFGLFAMILAFFSSTIAFSNENSTAITGSDNTCTVTVKYKNGSLAKSVKVSTEVSGGISCVGGRKFYTNSDGKATLEWSKGCYLKTVYVNGTGYKVDYKDGNNYTLTIN